MTANHITNTIRVTGAKLMGPEQAKTIVTFREQYPEYADSDLEIELAENGRSVTIHPKSDPAFSIHYYMVEPLPEQEQVDEYL